MRERVVQLLEQQQRVSGERFEDPLGRIVRVRRGALRNRRVHVDDLLDLLQERERKRVVDRP